MGNESSFLADCKLDSDIPVTTPKAWRLYHEKKRDGSKVSVFVYEKSGDNTAYIENAAKYLKVLRHPSILKFDALEKNDSGIFLATEQVTPLETALEDMSSTEIVAGIYNILEGVAFLHERGGLCHNNLCISSVFVASDGLWKLGGLEYLCRFEQATSSYLQKCRASREHSAQPPEEKTSHIDNTAACGQARDAFAFGVLAEQLLQYLDDLGEMTKTFELRIQDECLNPDPKQRPLLSNLLQDRLFRNDFCEIVNFLKNVTLKTEQEKRTFFWDLTPKLFGLPIEVVASRLTSLLLARFVLLDHTACERVLPHLLTPAKERASAFVEGEINPVLPERLFRRHVMPQLFKIFHVRDAHIRMVLLRHFSSYVSMFDSETLRRVILPQLLLGIRDCNDELVEMSLYAVAKLVPILGGDIVVGANRGKVFAEGQPKFGGRQPEGKTPRENGDITTKAKVTRDREKTLKELAKEAEREKRREDARKRNEERRKKRQERVLQQPKLAVQTGDTTQEKVNSVEVNSVQPSDDGEKPAEEAAPAVSDDKNSDWLDWENKEANQKADSDHADSWEETSDSDSDMEEQLESVDSPKPNGRLEIYSPGMDEDVPKVSWNDVTTIKNIHNSKDSTSVKGALKLKGGKVPTSPPPKSSSTVSEQIWDDSQWENEDVEIPISPTSRHNSKVATKGKTSPRRNSDTSNSSKFADKGKVKDSGTRKSTGQNQRKIKTDQWKDKPLGADYEIKKVDSVAGGQDDFFSDMQPTIKSDPNSLWSMLQGGGGEEKKTDKTTTSPKKGDREAKKSLSDKSTLSFAVAEDTQENEGGWDEDDLDWTLDDAE